MFAVSDGAHNGNASFFFLPPLFKMPTVHPGTFNPNLSPSVEICDLGPRPATIPPPPQVCLPGVPLVAHFPPGSVNVSTSGENYNVNWHTDASNLVLGNDYRIRVLVGGVELGFADVDPVGTGKELKNVQTGEYVGLVDGRTLPIKFRIENGALCAAGAACGSATVDLATGGGVELTLIDGGTIVEVFRFDVRAGTTAEFGGQTITDVTFNLEECADGGVDLDLRRFGRCLQVSTFFELSGGGTGTELAFMNDEFDNPLTISTCRLEGSGELAGLTEDEEAFITLHQQDGLTVRALSHAQPNCDVISSRDVQPTGLVDRGLRHLGQWAARFFVPQPLHARSRSAVINLGAGGGTHRLGTDCLTAPTPSAGRMLLAECAPASAPARVAAAFVGSARTTSKFQFFQPAIMARDDATTGLTALVEQAVAQPPAVFAEDAQNLEEPVSVEGAFVTFAIISGGGNFGMNGATPITEIRIPTNSDGVAQVPTWILGSEPGLNVVRARGKGIAARPRDTKPFVPDISGANETVELPTPTDAHFVEFTATGVTPRIALIDCQTGAATGGDQLSRGFYIPTYPGTSLQRVEMSFSADDAGDFTISLTARANTYDGPVIGTATAAVTLPANRNTFVEGTFEFSSAAFAPGSAVTFALAQVSGPSTTVFYEVPSAGNEACPIVQTNGTEAPLSTFRRNGVEVRVFGNSN